MKKNFLFGRTQPVPGRTGAFLAGCLFLLQAMLPSGAGAENAVRVTLEAGKPLLEIGETTTLSVYGMIDNSVAPESDQIFSFYIDVIREGDAAAGYFPIESPIADNHPNTSSNGVTSDGDLLGVYDTFLQYPMAGQGEPVLLLRFGIQAQAPGISVFSVRAGSTGKNLSDFLVHRIEGGAFTGGNYGDAQVTVEVAGSSGNGPTPPVLSVNFDGANINIQFVPVPGYDHTVQYSDNLLPLSWVALPGAPHNSGSVVDPAGGRKTRYYRVILSRGQNTGNQVELTIQRVGTEVQLRFLPVPGYDHTVQYSDNLLPLSWVALPGAPHNSGSVVDPAGGLKTRYYRVILSQGQNTGNQVELMIQRVGTEVQVQFLPVPGYDHYVQYTDFLEAPNWVELDGGPHQSGLVSDHMDVGVRRFYRILLQAP